MTIAFHSFNYTSNVLSSISYKHGKRYGTRVNPALAIPPSSTFFCTEDSSNLQDSKKMNLGRGSLLKHDATIGIIGGECVARELKDANLKPIETGYPPRIGVLATSTLVAGFYQDKLRNEGFEVVLPDKATIEHTIIPAIEALHNNDMEGARTLLRIALQVLLVRAVNIIVLASEEMRDLLPKDDPLLKKCIDPMDALARSTIKWARSPEKH